MIAQTSGSNANEIIKEIDKVTAEIAQGLPKGMELVDLMSSKDFLDASIKNVIKTLIEAILLVVLVVYVFLQNLRSTFIPVISIIVSPVGTFVFLYAAGFSLNMLTLFALVLVIGTVVDDAIVVVEAVQASPEFRLDTEALNNMFVRNSNGEMSPVSQYLTLTRVYGAESLTRFNLFSTISINGAPQLITRSTLDNQRFPESLSTGVPLQLLHRRPDIRQKEAELAEAFYATNQARSAFYPSITLGGSAGWTNSAGDAITNPGQWLLSTVGSLVQPLFNRGQNIANLKVAKAQQEEALLTFRQSLLDAGTEVNDALVQWQKAQGRLALSKQQVISLQSAVRSSELLMRHSSQNYLEVLTARQTLLQAELSVASNRFDEIQGVNLYHALGGGY